MRRSRTLLRANVTKRLVVIHGVGGVGKSSLLGCSGCTAGGEVPSPLLQVMKQIGFAYFSHDGFRLIERCAFPKFGKFIHYEIQAR
jgi:hypothetical protein